jgi:hypothetical protein
MSDFWRNVSPSRAVRDIFSVLGAPSEFRWRALGLAGLVTGGIFYVMVQQEGRGPPKPPEIIYFESWRDDRSDAEIIAGNIAAAKAAKQEEAEQEAREERARQVYRALGRASGIDTQKMYDDGKAERAAQKQAEDRKSRELLERLAAKPAAK